MHPRPVLAIALALSFSATSSLIAQKFLSIDHAASPNQLVVVDVGSGSMVVTPIGSLGFTVSDPTRVSMVVHNGRVFVIDSNFYPTRLLEIDPMSGSTLGSQLMHEGSGSPANAIVRVEGACSFRGELRIVYDRISSATTTIGTVDVATGIVTNSGSVAAGIADSDAMTYSSNGDMWVIDRFVPVSGESTLYRAEPNGTVTAGSTSLPSDSFSDITALRDQTLWALDAGAANSLYEISPNGTIVRAFGAGASNLATLEPFDMLAVAPPKFLSVDTVTDRLVLIDPATGDASDLGPLDHGVALGEVSLAVSDDRLYMIDASGTTNRTEPATIVQLYRNGASASIASLRIPVSFFYFYPKVAEGFATRSDGVLHLSFSELDDSASRSVANVSPDGTMGTGPSGSDSSFSGIDMDALCFDQHDQRYCLDRHNPAGSTGIFYLQQISPSSGEARNIGALPGTTVTDITTAPNGQMYALRNGGGGFIYQVDWRGGIAATFPLSQSDRYTGLVADFEFPQLRCHGASAAAGVGDVDGDGAEDYAVGNWGARTVVLHSGANGSVLHSWGINEGFFGWVVSRGGDVDGDGTPDVVVGSRSGDGIVRVFSGANASLLHSVTGTAGQKMNAAAGGGDCNGDGFADFVVGAHGDNGEAGLVRVYSGKDGTILHTWNGSAGARLGVSVANAGDVDADGYDDVVAGGNGGPGTAVVYSGRTGSVLHTLTDSAGDFGFDVDGAGDVDADGHDDVIVSNYSVSQGAGRAFVYSGADGSTLLSFFGDDSGDQLGFGVTGAGDVNGDGYDDVLVTAPKEDGLVDLGGVVRVFSGLDGSTLCEFQGTVYDVFFGVDRGVASADVDGDGFTDIIISSYLEACVWTSNFGGFDAAHHPISGTACPGGNGNLPRIDLRGRSSEGTTPAVELRGAPASTQVALGWGSASGGLSLDVIGATGCTLYVNPWATTPQATGAQGLASLPFPVPNGLLGVSIQMQWFVLDFGVPAPLKVTLSDTMRFSIGR